MKLSDAPVPHLVVRRGVPADARALAVFAATAFADTFGPDNRPDDMAAYLGEAFGEARQGAELADPACTVLIAERGGEMAGYAMLREGPAPAAVGAGAAIEIARLYAGRRWIGAGIGSALMQRCVDEAISRRLRCLWLGVWERNARAIAFYSRWGFTDAGSRHFQLGGDRQTDRIMARVVAVKESTCVIP
jgi:diamine N-acetyltransferase